MKRLFWLTMAAACLGAFPGLGFAQATPENPLADSNARTTRPAAAASASPEEEKCLREMAGYTHQSVTVAMRDGVKLRTEIFLPKGKGDGPWPVVLQRTPYTRWDIANRLGAVRGATVAVVTQNQRGRFGSEGAGTFPIESFDNEVQDSYDTIEWAAGQKWSNGKVGMIGVSGHGIAGFNAIWSGAPHLVAVNVSITSDNAYYLFYNNGVRRYLYDWIKQRGGSPKPWPRPTTAAFDANARQAFLAERGAKCRAAFANESGWYDIFSEALLDAFVALAPTKKVFLTIGPDGHGPIGGELKYPKAPMPTGLKVRTFKQWMTEEAPKEPTESTLVYYLMGDTRDAAAPGNVWKATGRWPVPSTATSFYLQKDGTLTAEAPKDKDASLSYTYDPKDPARSLGGNYEFKGKNGPHDQRPLKDRKDVLRFVTEPLKEPVGITGKVMVELHVSSDAPDTTFVATLVDIYPDGYEALVRTGAMMARYWQGLDKPARLEKGKVYRLEMDLWSTALVFNKGHRIAVLVTSSSTPAFEVHPNTYDPVDSIEKAAAARNTIHLSAGRASRVILPVVPKETYAK